MTEKPTVSEKKTPPKKISHETRVNLAFGISLGEWVLAGLVGILSGLTAAAATVRSTFKVEMKSWPGITSLYSDHTSNLAKINSEFRNKPERSWKEHAVAISKAKSYYATQVDNVLEHEYKILSRGDAPAFSVRAFKAATLGTWQRYNFSGVNHDKKQIAFNAVISAAIGAGATLSFFNGVASRHKIEQIADANEQNQSR